MQLITDIRKENIRAALMDFQQIEHRLEHVCKIGHVDFINDSKSTAIGSTWFSLESMQRQVVWIVTGGMDTNYTFLQDLVKEKVRVIVCLGDFFHKIHEAFPFITLILSASSVEEAVLMAHKFSRPNETVLFSPAAKSYEGYESLGRRFKMAAQILNF